MATAGLVVRILLSAVLLTSGAGKLADRRGTERSLRGFGVPSGLVATLALLLPLTEIAIAVALLPATTAAWAALAAAVLLGIFVVAIARVLRAGETPDCHCFGVVHSAPVSGATLARTGALAVLAAAVAAADWSGAKSAVAWIGDLSATGALALGEGVALAALAGGSVWLGIQLLRQNGRLLIRLDAVERAVGLDPGADAQRAPEGLPIGADAPPFTLPLRHGGVRSLDQLGDTVLLIFADAGCGPCRSLFEEVGGWRAEARDREIAVILGGDPEAASDVADDVPVLLADGRQLQADYAVFGTPTGVLVRDGRIASDTAPGAGAIRRLAAASDSGGALNVEQIPGRAERLEVAR